MLTWYFPALLRMSATFNVVTSLTGRIGFGSPRQMGKGL
jgi:hypothetical protein